MPLSLIDSHAHLQFPAYHNDRDAVFARANDFGIGVVNVGTQYLTSNAAIDVAERYQDSWAAVGFHPGHLSIDAHYDPMELEERNQEQFDPVALANLARHPKVVAIGECGLDYSRITHQEKAIKQQQEEVFLAQMEIAKSLEKPLIIHCRSAFPDLIRMLTSFFMLRDSRPRGVIHFFSGTWNDAEQLLALGFFFGFGGVVTFARDYDEPLSKIPLDRILIETDAPYVAPTPYRGKRNEPAYIIETVRKIAEIRGISYDEVAQATLDNARRLFKI